jgi:hypothetical protein
MGNCLAGGKEPQPQVGSCCTQTPQRIVALLAVTMECCVKSRPLGSLAEWHSMQYFEKNPWPQLAHVSDPDPESDRDPELDPDPDPELDPDPDPELDPEEHAAASSPTASKA